MSQLFTIAVFSENHVGLLNQVSIIFTRRCLNIETLSVSPTALPGIHKITITCQSERSVMEKVVKQIEKRIDVLRSFLYTDDELVYQEVALYKVPTLKLIEEQQLEQVIRRHNARILEINQEYTVIEKTGHDDETLALFAELRNYDIKQFVRSGRVAVTRSPVEYVDLFLAEQERRRNRMNS